MWPPYLIFVTRTNGQCLFRVQNLMQKIALFPGWGNFFFFGGGGLILQSCLCKQKDKYKVWWPPRTGVSLKSIFGRIAIQFWPKDETVDMTTDGRSRSSFSSEIAHTGFTFIYQHRKELFYSDDVLLPIHKGKCLTFLPNPNHFATTTRSTQRTHAINKQLT